MQIAVADIGGTHARFALADVGPGRVESLHAEMVLRVAEYATFEAAWAKFIETVGPRPAAAAIALACPIEGEVLRLTNNPWVINRGNLADRLGLEQVLLLNDFEAIGHCVATIEYSAFESICGPKGDLPRDGAVTVIGPGTGLGVAVIVYQEGRHFVLPTEGSHASFAPLDAIEDRMLLHLRKHYPRVSAERVVSGKGLLAIYRFLAEAEGRSATVSDERALWEAALTGADPLAVDALERFFLCFGAFAGDMALAHGANAVVIAGGLGQRLRHVIGRSGFAARFAAKGRFEALMANLPVKLITHAQPGLYGAAAALAAELPPIAAL